MKRLLFALALLGLTTTARAGGGHLFPGVIGPAGGGTGSSTQTATGAIIFGGANGVYTSNPAYFFWDNTNNRLGVGTSAPQTSFHAIGTPTTRAILVNSPDPGFAQSANTTGEIALFGTAYSASNASMLDLLSYSTSSANPLFRISNHWEGSSSSGTIGIGYYQGSNFNDVLVVTSMTRVGIGTINPLSTFDVKGSAAFGTYGGANAAPSNGFIVSGNVGIGTANPSTKLHLSSGTLTLDGNTNNMLDLLGTSALMGIRTLNPAQAFHLSSGTILVDGNTANALIAPGSTQLIGLRTANPTQALHISSGVVLIDGNVATPLVLTQSGNGTAGDITFNDRQSGGTAQSWRFGPNLAIGNGEFSLYDNTAAKTVFTVDLNQRIGIGSIRPATQLHMSSGTLTLDGNTQLVLNAGGTIRSWSRTKAQIDTTTPGAVGEQVFCSDCATPDICVSTGTSAAQFRRVGTTAGCGSGN